MKIIFVRTNACGSGMHYGVQAADNLAKFGIDAQCIYREEFLRTTINADIMVAVKHLTKEMSLKARKQNMKVVVDVVDNKRICKAGFLQKDLFDGIIFCTKTLRDYLQESLPLCHAVIYQQPDIRYVSNAASKYCIAYVGPRRNIPKEYRSFVDIVGTQEIKETGYTKKIFKTIGSYSCHFNVRPEGSEHFLYKPNTKLATAAACMANIVMSRDSAHIELMDQSYPYYTASDLASVKKTLDLARRSYRDKLWRHGLDMIRDLRERLSPQNVAQQYIAFFKEVLG